MMDESVETTLTKTDQSTADAPPQQKRRRSYRKHGDRARQRQIRARGLAAIDGRSYEGKIALAWQASALKTKGGATCPHWLKVEIRLATFDLWRLLHLQSYLIADCNERQALINKRYRVLPSIHSQYDQVEFRFARRVEALDLGKGGGGMDLAQRLAAAQRERQVT